MWISNRVCCTHVCALEIEKTMRRNVCQARETQRGREREREEGRGGLLVEFLVALLDTSESEAEKQQEYLEPRD